MKIEDQTLSVTIKGKTTAIDLPDVRTDAVVRVWQVPKAYRANGIFAVVTEPGQDQEYPACAQRDAEYIGQINYPAPAAAKLRAAKDALTDAATAQRWAVMTSGLTLPDGTRVGTTIDDQNRITSVVANAGLVGLSDGDEVDFKAESGWVRITLAQIKTLAGAIGAHVQACYTAERAHHAAIAAIADLEAVEQYDVTTGWPTNE